MFSSQGNKEKNQTQTRRRLSCLILAGFFVVFIIASMYQPVRAAGGMTSPGGNTPQPEDDSADLPGFQSYENPAIELISPHALVVDISRGMVLYDKSSAVPQSTPLVGQLMTIVLALENLQPDQSVTISRDVAMLGESDSRNLGLEAGEQVRVDFLLRALHYNDSETARLALAEAVSQTEDRFLEQMRSKAQELGLTATTFTRLPGAEGGLLQQSTLTDTAVLLRYALRLPFYQALFHQKTYTHFDLSGGQNYFFNNPLESSWTIWSNNTVNGSAYSATGGQESAAYTATANNIEVIFLLQAPAVSEEPSIFETSRFNQDVRTMTSRIFSYYDTTVLLRQYQPLTQAFEIEGERVPLIALQTISYVHPQGDQSIQTTTLVRSSQNQTLPVMQYEVLGQAVYTLTNGTILSADIGAMETVYSTETFVDRLQALMAAYRSLTILIVALASILLIMWIRQGVRHLFRLYYQTQLDKVEGSSKRSSNQSGQPKPRTGGKRGV